LITKDPQREYKDLLASPEHNIKFISRVVGLAKLKGKFKPFEARRELLREHDMFLCDDRVLATMPKLLGSMFFDAKKWVEVSAAFVMRYLTMSFEIMLILGNLSP
jgi:ribosome biogenesis protein UTP30